MTKLSSILKSIFCSIVVDMNDLYIEEELLYKIADSLVEEKLRTVYSESNEEIVGSNYNRSKTFIESKVKLDGVWLYLDDVNGSWKLIKFNNIESAMNVACNHIGYVKLLNDGFIVDWDIIDNKNALYVKDGNIKIANF